MSQYYDETRPNLAPVPSPSMERAAAEKLAQHLGGKSAATTGYLAPANCAGDVAAGGPGSILLDQLGQLMGHSERIVQDLNAIHAKLGGPLPERAGNETRNASPVPCGGAIGGAIQASRAITTNLERADDLLGYLRALIA